MSLQNCASETKNILQQKCLNQDGTVNQSAILDALATLSQQFSQQLRRQDVAENIQSSIVSALNDIRQHQQDANDVGGHISSAATQEKLDILLAALDSSRKELAMLVAMSSSQQQLLSIMESKGNILPLKFIIVPDIKRIAPSSNVGKLKHTAQKVFSELKQKVYKVFWNKVRLFFVCDISDECAEGGPNNDGYELEIPTKTLKVLSPVLKFSVGVLKTALMAQGIPAGILPHLPECVDYKMQDVLDEMISSVGSFSGKDDEDQLTAIQEGQVDELFKLIQKCEGCDSSPLTGWEPKHTGLEKVSVSLEAHSRGVMGSSKWVLRKYKDEYKEYGEDAAARIKSKQKQSMK
jgi:hypothetical protein